jgi:hypothetical protein
VYVCGGILINVMDSFMLFWINFLFYVYIIIIYMCVCISSLISIPYGQELVTSLPYSEDILLTHV